MIKTIAVDKRGDILTDVSLQRLKDQDIAWFWVDFDQPTRSEINLLSTFFKFHELLIEDCLTLLQRPKIEISRQQIFLVSHVLKNLDDDYETINMFVGKNYIVTSGIILSYGLYNICIVPINSILFPTVMNLEFHVPSEVYGTVEGIITLGMLLSGILVACRPGWFHFSKIYLWNYPMPTVMVLMGLILLFPAGTYAGIAALALGGMTIMFCLGVGNIVTLTYMQNVIPSQMLGSVSALSTAVATGTVPIGQVLFGQLMESRLPSGCILLLSAFVAALVSWYVRKNIQRCKTFESK